MRCTTQQHGEYWVEDSATGDIMCAWCLRVEVARLRELLENAEVSLRQERDEDFWLVRDIRAVLRKRATPMREE